MYLIGGNVQDMDVEYLKWDSDLFDEIVEDIKQKNLSRSNMPKIVVGTGLSLTYGVPGMKALAQHLNEEICQFTDEHLKKIWEKYCDKIEENGLEAGLANLAQNENELVDVIKTITAKFILQSEEKLHKEIYDKDTGFCKLLSYLCGTVSVDKKVIDIMTPNYDRIIEIICDRLGIGVITGFSGSLYGRFNINLLKQPTEVFNCKNYAWIRLFKPHGSINWINDNEAEAEYLTNDYRVLEKKADCIEIVTPGCSKYRVGMTNNTFRCMREEFNELLNQRNSFSLLFYGYGFNDDHFDTAFLDCFEKKNVLIISKNVKKDIINKALGRKNVTVFYHDNDQEYMIYKAKKYKIDLPLWDIDQFSELFIG